MNKKNNKRIGIFIYDWGMYHYIKDFAIKFAETGYFVDIFFKDWDLRPDYANTDQFNLYNNIRFYNFTTKATNRQVFKRRCKRLLNMIAIPFSIPLNDRADEIINRDILNQSKEIIGTSQL